MIFEPIVDTTMPYHIRKQLTTIPQMKVEFPNVWKIPDIILPQNNIPPNQPLNDFQRRCIEEYSKNASHHVTRMRSNVNPIK